MRILRSFPHGQTTEGEVDGVVVMLGAITRTVSDHPSNRWPWPPSTALLRPAFGSRPSSGEGSAAPNSCRTE